MATAHMLVRAMEDQASRPEVGAIRIHFRCADPLSPDQVNELASQLVGGLPVAPDEVVVAPEGDGWIVYREEDAITLDDLAEAVRWLRRDPRMTEVRWKAVADL